MFILHVLPVVYASQKIDKFEIYVRQGYIEAAWTK
jgi:hypothetical protein